MLTATARTTLRQGSTGEEVKYLQLLINSFYGSILKVDGVFGSQTETHVKRFQYACKIAVDGVVGSQTWQYLEEMTSYAAAVHSTLREGSTGGEVKYLQVRLNDYLGPKLVVDGVFGAETAAQVQQFQHAFGGTVDGIVGPQTWRYLDRPDFDI